jgi:hypothetical protein
MPIRPRVDFRDPALRAVGALGVPVVAVSAANFVGTTIRAALLYTVPGGFTTYTFCFQLIMMPYGIFAVAIATVLYPAMSRHAASDDRAAFKEVVATGVRWSSMIMLPVAAGLALLAEPVARVLFQRGQFTYSDTVFTARFLSLYALSIFPYALVVYATRVFYSLQDTRTPAWINIAGVALNIALNFALLRTMGAPGIALASAITYTVTAVVSFVVLRMRLGSIGGRPLADALARLAVATAVMSLAVWAVLAGTRPPLTIVERGPRAALRLPEWAAGGQAFVVNDRESYARLRDEWGAEMSMAPDMDFRRESFVLILGPQSPTTVTLELTQTVRSDDGGASFTIAVHRAQTKAEPRVFRLPPKPAYLMAVLRPPVSAATPQFVVTDAPVPSRWARIAQAPEALRLVLTVVFGAAVFLAACAALGINDLRVLLNEIRQRRRRRDAACS